MEQTEIFEIVEIDSNLPPELILPVKAEIKEEIIGKRPKRSNTTGFKYSAEDITEFKKRKRLRCKLCRQHKGYLTQSLLDKHMKEAHGRQSQPTEFICEYCSMSLKSEVYYKRHLLARHPKTPKTYICDFDGREFPAKDYIRIHMDRHRAHPILTCNVCQKSYLSLHTFRRHLKLHIDKHICSVCGILFHQKFLLDNHYASKHSDELPHPCDFCTRMFPSKTARNNHHYIAHKKRSAELSFKCNECNIYFEMKEELRIHSFIHFDGEIKTCLECNQIFKTNRLLKIHMQKHSTKKSFQCQTCGDYFTFKTGLAKHIRMNRCKGFDSFEIKSEAGGEIQHDELAEIARNQLKEVTLPSKKLPKIEENEICEFKEEICYESEVEEEFSNEVEKMEADENIVEEIFTTETIEEGTSCRRNAIPYKEVHQITHTRTGRAHLIYECDFCGEKVKFKKRMIEHLKQHTIFQRYSCKECNSTFKSRKAVLVHCLNVHGIKASVVSGIYVCEHCDKRFDTRSIFESHMKTHDENSRCHKCNYCDAVFKTVGNLRRHEAIHAPTRSFHCQECPKSFKTMLALKIHNEAVHSPWKVFVNCTVCKAIIQERHLNLHMKNQHTEEGQAKPFSCTVCFKTFKTEKLGQRHYESVHEPKNVGIVYNCPHCPELSFNRQRELKEHSFIHFDGDIHQCPVCLKMFTNKRLLVIHSSVHDEFAQSFPCGICENVTFKTRGGRRKHMAKNHATLLVKA